MNKFSKLYKLILQIFFFYYFIFITSGITLEKIYTGQSLSNYFSGVVALNSNQYEESYNFLKKNENLENTHSTYSRAYIKSLINSSKINEAYRYAHILKKKKLTFFKATF